MMLRIISIFTATEPIILFFNVLICLYNENPFLYLFAGLYDVKKLIYIEENGIIQLLLFMTTTQKIMKRS